jgi:hypothetical protein
MVCARVVSLGPPSVRGEAVGKSVFHASPDVNSSNQIVVCYAPYDGKNQKTKKTQRYPCTL